MVRSARNSVIAPVLAFAALAAGAATLSGCAPSGPVKPPAQVEYQRPDGTYAPVPQDGVHVPTPKWIAGEVVLKVPENWMLTTGQGATLTQDSADPSLTDLTYTGSEAPRTLATLGAQPVVSNEVAQGRVYADANPDQFYTAVAIGDDPNVAGSSVTPQQLETLVSDTIGGSEYAGLDRFYAVMSKDSSGVFSKVYSTGAIAGPPAVEQLFSELEACANGSIGYVQVRTLQGDFGAQGQLDYGTVLEAYSENGTCLVQALVGSSPDLAPIASRTAKVATEIAPEAAAAAYVASSN